MPLPFFLLPGNSFDKRKLAGQPFFFPSTMPRFGPFNHPVSTTEDVDYPGVTRLCVFPVQATRRWFCPLFCVPGSQCSHAMNLSKFEFGSGSSVRNDFLIFKKFSFPSRQMAAASQRVRAHELFIPGEDALHPALLPALFLLISSFTNNCHWDLCVSLVQFNKYLIRIRIKPSIK